MVRADVRRNVRCVECAGEVSDAGAARPTAQFREDQERLQIVIAHRLPVVRHGKQPAPLVPALEREPTEEDLPRHRGSPHRHLTPLPGVPLRDSTLSQEPPLDETWVDLPHLPLSPHHVNERPVVHGLPDRSAIAANGAGGGPLGSDGGSAAGGGERRKRSGKHGEVHWEQARRVSGSVLHCECHAEESWPEFVR